MMSDAQVGASDDVGLETFKAGAVLTEEEQPHASPSEQWVSLAEALTSGASISHTSQVMREISDAVAHELQKEVRAARHCTAHLHVWQSNLFLDRFHESYVYSSVH
jgi:hypothetical protein